MLDSEASLANMVGNKLLSNERRQDLIRKPATWDPSETATLEKALMHADNLAGLYYPTRIEAETFPVIGSPAEPLPTPPSMFWHWYAQNEESYLAGGRSQARRFREAAIKSGYTFAPGTRMLDFGCSGGRVTRWFVEDARAGVEVWGCDIDAPAIEWCQKSIMPPLRFFANSTAPHLPFRDGYLDFVFAGSVINHIKDMATSWMMEVARCIKPGGIFIPTIIDEHSLPQLRKVYEDQPNSVLPKFVVEADITPEIVARTGFINRYSTSSPWLTGVIYSQEFFTRRASLAFDVIDVIPSLKGYQTGYVLRVRGG